MKKSNQIVSTLIAMLVLALVYVAVLFCLSYFLSLFWNMVMPIFGLPELSALQAAALYLITKILRYQSKDNAAIRATKMAMTLEQAAQTDERPRNKYPI